jgi:hypothetical protein
MATEKMNHVSGKGPSASQNERWERICLVLENLITHAEQCGDECMSRGSDKIYSQIATVVNRMKRIRKEIGQRDLCAKDREKDILFHEDYGKELDAIHGKIEQSLELCRGICDEFSHAETNMNITKRCSEMHENLGQIESLIQDRLKYLRISSVI